MEAERATVKSVAEKSVDLDNPPKSYKNLRFAGLPAVLASEQESMAADCLTNRTSAHCSLTHSDLCKSRGVIIKKEVYEKKLSQCLYSTYSLNSMVKT